MLATLLFVVAPIVFRLLGNLSWLQLRYAGTAYRFSYAMGVGNAVAIAIALYLYSRSPKHGGPFIIAAGVIAAQEITFETLGRLPAWAPMFGQSPK